MDIKQWLKRLVLSATHESSAQNPVSSIQTSGRRQLIVYAVGYQGHVLPQHGVFISEDLLRDYFKGVKKAKSYYPVPLVLQQDFAAFGASSLPAPAKRSNRFWPF